MKKILNSKYFIAIWLVIVALFNAVLFLIKKENFTNSFWISYSFIMGAFVVLLLSAIVFRPKNNQGIYPTVSFAGLFLIVVMILGVVFFFFPNIPYLGVLIPMLIITGLFLILAIFGIMQNEWIRKNPQKVPEVFNMEQLRPYLENLLINGNEPAVVNGIQDLLKLVDNIDTNNKNTETDSIDKSIFEYAQFLRKNIDRNEKQNVFNNINKLKSLLQKRIDLNK